MTLEMMMLKKLERTQNKCLNRTSSGMLQDLNKSFGCLVKSKLHMTTERGSR